jgi:hypothetical protein
MSRQLSATEQHHAIAFCPNDCEGNPIPDEQRFMELCEVSAFYDTNGRMPTNVEFREMCPHLVHHRKLTNAD